MTLAAAQKLIGKAIEAIIAEAYERRDYWCVSEKVRQEYHAAVESLLEAIMDRPVTREEVEECEP